MAVVLTSITPNNGTPGTSVHLVGSGFIQGGLRGVVSFIGANASTIYSYTNTDIVCAVPAGATTGTVFVEVVNQKSNTLSFTVNVPATPHITSLTPNNGGIGIGVTIAGTNFGASQGMSTVTFNGIAATVQSWSATSIVVSVPVMATTGPVVVTVGGVASNGVTFTVTSPSNGGTSAALNLLLFPAPFFSEQAIGFLDTTNFNDQAIGSFYSYKVEEVAAGRTPTCSRQILTYRDIGVATLTATLSGTLSPVGDANTPTVTSSTESFKIGTAGATGKLFTIVRGLTLTAENLQYTLTRQPAAGPVSIVKTRLEGRVELTAYA
jgi:IPT/TIG domain